MSKRKLQAFTIPGTQRVLLYERADSGRLIKLSCNGAVYLEEHEGRRVYGDKLAMANDAVISGGLLRHVTTAHESWTEKFLWNEQGLLTHIDGVNVRRDERRRVIACVNGHVQWHYAYAEDELCSIEGPFGVRHVTHGQDQRPIRLREAENFCDLAYDGEGRRLDRAPLPESWHRDELGRLWTITTSDGFVKTTFLWDGFACLGRIDGAPGEPLAAVFSLDPTCTPVRIIERDRVTRLSRDAFGEGLLAHRGVPGLFGGAIYNRLVHLRSRTLDPRLGAFHQPDPWHGQEDDPRRTQGYHGPLLVENAAGPYAVSQYDPLHRVDPTGEISIPLILSDFTWSLQNNLLGWLGLDLVVNFWGSIFTGNFGRFFDFEGLSSSDRLGGFGIRRDGMVTYKNPSRAWTYQHQVWAIPEEIHDLAHVRVFDPKGEFRPTLYGTLLLAEPAGGERLLLRGSGNTNAEIPRRALGWTRAGGKAEPVIPGAIIPHFPSGGLHFDNVIAEISGPKNCTLTELEASGQLGIGTIEERAVLVIPQASSGLSEGSLVLLTDSGTAVFITSVLSLTTQGEATQVRLETEATGLGPAQVRLRGLSAPSAAETLNAGTATGSLLTAGSTLPFAKGDPLRLSQGGSEVGAALIQRLEARLQLDAPLPTGLTSPLQVVLAQISGTPGPATLTSDVNNLEFPAGQPIPAVGEMIVVRGSGNTLAVVVLSEPAAQQRRVDRVLSTLGASSSSVTWQLLIRGTDLGKRAEDPETGSAITYEADTVRTAPATGFVRIEAQASGLAVRTVTGLDYDALILGAALPGNSANPYQVERFTIQAPDHEDLSLDHIQALALQNTITFDGVALQLHQTNGNAITAGARIAVGTGNLTASVSGAVATATIPIASLPTTPTPSQFVVLRQGGNVEAALVKEVRATITFDRDLSLSSSGLSVVLLEAGGPVYRAERLDVRLVRVRPEVAVSGANVRVQMPRFQPGEIVEANWTGAPRRHYFRIAPPEGTTLTLEGDNDLPTPTPNLTITRFGPDNPATGGSRAGINGIPINPVSGATRQVQFRVWQPDALPGNPVVAIVDGNTSHPAVVDGSAARPLEIEFGAAPGLTGANIEITLPTLTATGYASSFTQEGAVILSNNDVQTPFNPATPTTNLVVAIPFKKSDRKAENGELGAGKVLVPEDPEHAELDRKQSLIDHELRHTIQSATWGPLLLCWFPLFALEGILEATTDIELPKFSPYVPGTVTSEGASRFLTIPNFQGIEFETGTQVQISSAGTAKNLSLGAAEGNKFKITAGTELRDGAVQVRRQTADSFWRDVPLNVMQFLSHGGLLNTLTGGIYGGIFFGMAKLIYALGRTIFGEGDNFPALVENSGINLRLQDQPGKDALRGARLIIVQSGEASVVRSVVSTVKDLVTLSSAVEFTTDVRVAPYSTHTPDSAWDWHDYFPATVPDANRPAAIKIEPANGSTLTLSAFDRVTVTADDTSSLRTNVTAVAADGTVELEEPPPTSGSERNLRVAKIDERDPMGNADSFFITEMGLGWMRWIFDPYGQLQFRLQPDPKSFWGIVARIARYAFGTQSWSAIIPGWFIWDNAIKQAGSNPKGHLSQMEQDASEESGDLYSPLGRLRGDLAVVGDIARYWYFIKDRDGTISTIIRPARQDAPGVHILQAQDLRLLPFVTNETGGAAPNNGAEAPPVADEPGMGIPDLFTQKNFADPRDVLTAAPLALNDPARSFAANDRGFIPASPALERTCGMYAAFTRPGRHRITVRNGITGAAEGREAQTEGKQSLFFEKNISAVNVVVAGINVAEALPGQPLTKVQLVRTQRATIVVTPNNNRRYAITLMRPANGEALRTEGDAIIVAQTPATAITEPVEISRVYRFDAAANAFDAPELNHHGVHLPGDLHIPVRLFEAEVVNTIPFRKPLPEASALANDQALNKVDEARPGEEVFALVPAAILSPLRLDSVSYTPAPPPNTLNPTPDIDAETVANGLRAFLGSAGGVFKITFPENDPPEEEATLRFLVDVGVTGNSASLEAGIKLIPHFRLTAAGFQVQRGNSLTLQCTDGFIAEAVVVTPSEGLTTSGAGSNNVTITAGPSAALGVRRVVVDGKGADNSSHKARRSIEIIP